MMILMMMRKRRYVNVVSDKKIADGLSITVCICVSMYNSMYMCISMVLKNALKAFCFDGKRRLLLEHAGNKKGNIKGRM